MREMAGLVASLEEARVVGTLPSAVDALASDSRAVRPGTLFVALRGQRSDGHAYVGDAVRRGAAALVVEREVETDVPTIVVPDTRRAASQLADAFYDHPSRALTIVGVTGTNGKTTTTHLVRDVLEAAGIPCGLVGTLGGSFGERSWPLTNTTPLAIELHALLAAQRDAGARAVAMEVSSHALALDRVDDVRFVVAALTNITRDHLDFHGTMERYIAAKRHLFDLAPKAVLNLDDETGRTFAAALPDALTYAVDDRNATLHATELQLEGDGSSFLIDGAAVSIALPGRFNVRNALAAFGIGVALGIDRATIARGLAATRAVPGRMERIGAFGIDAIVDYAHTPDALENVLRAARETTRRQLIVVFGCGGDRDPGKRAEMGEIAAQLADRVIVTSDNPRTEDPLAIAQAIARGIEAEIELDRRAAIRRAIGDARPGDTVVIAGKGHETYQIVGTKSRPFDDRDEVRMAFDARAQGLRA
ncbi:MAG TPA: UDP-N-acetylmuramoyl-L-alanyl-D-glutamate--2,6-diaminopimelate ligase [Candidatus Sulfotelmatobacter sp.]|nr:UDP-N-acetylmuramoyl-L-alanyl-D-glutamate--2,6-diaminopimelate ligase [Candidatus Sulfotelmatobacter sp.]